MILPLHPEHRDPSHADSKVDLGLENVSNIDYQELKTEIIKRIPFATMEFSNEIYQPSLTNKSIVGDYYLSRPITYSDLSIDTIANTGKLLVENKNTLKSWLLELNGEQDYNYIPFNAFYQLSKNITDNIGLLLTRGVNIYVDFFDSSGENNVTEYSLLNTSTDIFSVYFKITDERNSIYSLDDNYKISDRFSFNVSCIFDGEDEEIDISEAIDSVSFNDDLFTLNLKSSYLTTSAKLTLSVEYIYYGIIRKVSCYITVPDYSVIFFKTDTNGNRTLLSIVNGEKNSEDEVIFNSTIEDSVWINDFETYQIYTILLAVLKLKTSTSLISAQTIINGVATGSGSIKSNLILVGSYIINSFYSISSTNTQINSATLNIRSGDSILFTINLE